MLLAAVGVLFVIAPYTDASPLYMYGNDCPNPSTHKDLQPQRLYGTWYGQVAYRPTYIGNEEWCPFFFVAPISTFPGNTSRVLSISHSAVFRRYVVDVELSQIHYALLETSSSLPNPKDSQIYNEAKYDGTYWFLSTDYDEYALIFACKTYFFYKMEYYWLLTRERNPPYRKILGYPSLSSFRELPGNAYTYKTIQNC